MGNSGCGVGRVVNFTVGAGVGLGVVNLVGRVVVVFTVG